jgi:hypothetical protein
MRAITVREDGTGEPNIGTVMFNDEVRDNLLKCLMEHYDTEVELGEIEFERLLSKGYDGYHITVYDNEDDNTSYNTNIFLELTFVYGL